MAFTRARVRRGRPAHRAPGAIGSAERLPAVRQFPDDTASGNNHTCSRAPSVIRGIHRYHVKGMGWRDIGYNVVVDKCGSIYEGRAGGLATAVLGAHTLGFNSNSMGSAVIGTYSSPSRPPPR